MKLTVLAVLPNKPRPEGRVREFAGMLARIVIEGRVRGSEVCAALCLASAIRRGACPEGWSL